MATQQIPNTSWKSSWRTGDKHEWNFYNHFMETLYVYHNDVGKEVPVHGKSDKAPYLSHTSCHIWIILHSLYPLAIHQLFIYCTGKNFHPAFAFFFYSFVFTINAVHELNALRRLGNKYGYLDGDKHKRDEVPAQSVRKVVQSLMMVGIFRPMMATMLAWKSSEKPTDISWWLPVQIGLYPVVLDFWFYWYHRLMHEVPSLWQYHRTHHLTKHPNPLLTIYADTVQEIFDIAVIPFLTWISLHYLGFHANFYDWFVCTQYVVFTEIIGHSGLRIYITPPSTFMPLLRLSNTELVVEDHDLHHRQGWKTSMNYGKQTLLWDRIFGTTGKRIELTHENIDFNQRVYLPWSE